MNQLPALSRRTLLKRGAQAAATAIAAPSFLPACSRGANEKVQLGFIGSGWRFHLIMNAMPEQGFAAVAFCDVHDERLASAKEEFNKDAATYKDYRDMLASDDVDAVVIATPEHWHALQSVDACKAGKDVYVEKPLALTIAEGRAVVNAARESKSVVQVGTQQRSRAVCVQGCQAVLDGAIGKVTEAHGVSYPSSWDCDIAEEQEVPKGLDWDTWLGQTQPRPFHQGIYYNTNDPRSGEYPDGRPRSWANFRPWSGGAMTAWGAHGLDVIQWGLDLDEPSGPIEVWPELEGGQGPLRHLFIELKDDSWKEGRALTCPVHFKYANGAVIHLDDKGPGFGGMFVGEEGIIMVARDVYQLKRPDEDMQTVREPRNSDGTTAHLKQWLECIKSRQPLLSNVERAHRSCTLCHLGNIARRVGRKIVWDPESETFGDDEEANSYIGREGREPWVVA